VGSESNTTARERREGKRRFEELRAMQLRKRKRRERVELPNNQNGDARDQKGEGA
jgi:hypothetical protein